MCLRAIVFTRSEPLLIKRSWLLLQKYLAERAALIDLKKASSIVHGNPLNSSDTVYLSTADKEGNACSFIASNYAGEFFRISLDG